MATKVVASSRNGLVGIVAVATALLTGQSIQAAQNMPHPAPSAPIRAYVAWPDRSEFQGVPYEASFQGPIEAFRTNDGNKVDRLAKTNAAVCRAASLAGRVSICIAYFVYEPGVDAAAIQRQVLGAPWAQLVSMADIESWQGKISGNHSVDINAEMATQGRWLGSPRRAIGYANAGDFARLWPSRNGANVILASYGTEVSERVAGQFAQQYTNGHYVLYGLPVRSDNAPPCDHNVYFGSLAGLLDTLGVTGTQGPVSGLLPPVAITIPPIAHPAPAVKPKPKVVAKAKPRARPVRHVYYRVRNGDILSRIAKRFGTTWRKLASLNHLRHPGRLHIRQSLLIH